MAPTPPTTRRAVALDRFGGPDAMARRSLPLPRVEAGEVLVALDAAGVGSWDPFEREGGYAELTGTSPAFSYVLGSEGAGTVAAVGPDVTDRQVGETVDATGFLDPKGGFQADPVVVPADLVGPVPPGMTTDQAAAFPGVAATALRGSTTRWACARERWLRSWVPAAASGTPTCISPPAWARGCWRWHRATTGWHRPAPGRAACPTGVQPEPGVAAATEPDVRVEVFNGDPDAELLDRLQALVTAPPPFRVHVATAFPLDAVADARAALDGHVLGKLVLHTRG